MEIAELIGVAPDWLELGPVEEVDGVKCRRVLNDQSGRGAWDRLPDYVTDAPIIVPRASDRGEDREPIRQVRPGRPISELRGLHSGRVAILFNGPSLADHDLWRIQSAGIPMIGTNRTHVGYPGYHGPQPDYLCVADSYWMTHLSVLAHPRLVNGTMDMTTVGYRATPCSRMKPFSFDLARDGYVAPIPCSTGHLALQMAVWLGFTEIYCLGLDLKGGHFDGQRGTFSHHYGYVNAYHSTQAPRLLERGISVYVCGSPGSRCTAFPHVPLEALFGRVH